MQSFNGCFALFSCLIPSSGYEDVMVGAKRLRIKKQVSCFPIDIESTSSYIGVHRDPGRRCYGILVSASCPHKFGGHHDEAARTKLT